MYRCSYTNTYSPSPESACSQSRLLLGATLALGLLAAAPAGAATYVVNTTVDTGTGGCTASECTLREAMIAANALPNFGDTINFSIPGDPVSHHLLDLASPLPTIFGPVVINGYSEPGSVENTAPNGFNAAVKIAVSGFALPSGSQGFRAQTDGNVTIRGIRIMNFFGTTNASGIVANGSGNVTIRGCLLEDNHQGILVDTNQTGTVTVGLSGATALANRNGIYGSAGTGILVRSGTGAVNIFSAHIDSSDTGIVPGIESSRTNTTVRDSIITDNGVGVWLHSPTFEMSGNTVTFNGTGIRFDTTAAGQAVIGGSGALRNTIANNTGDGIEHQAANLSIDFSENGFSQNGGLGVDLLGSNGVTANDSGDGDSGPNGLQNVPLLTSASRTQGNPTVTLAGTLNSLPNRNFRLRFYGNLFATAASDREGQLLGDSSVDVSTDGSGNGSFGPLQVNFNETGGLVIDVSATATIIDATSGLPTATSELSAAFTVATIVPPATLVVTSAGDSGDGVCDATCTLRDAVIGANGNANPGSIDRIEFAISGDVVHSIALNGSLPTPTEPVVIDGYTQPGATPNSDTTGVGSNASLRIHISPVGATGLFNAISNAPGVTLRGLAFTGFNVGSISATRLSGANARIEGCWFGLRPDGTEVLTRIGAILGSGAIFGGDAPAQRNIWINRSTLALGANGQVVNNLFGVKSDGRSAATVSTINEDSSLNSVAGTRVERNIFSTPAGRFAILASATEILDNAFGESFDGVTALSLGGAVWVFDGGVRITSATQRIRGALGGTTTAGANCANAAVCFFGNSSNTPTLLDQAIVGGTVKGVALNGAAHRTSIRSIISGTAGLGIDLNGDGVTLNDAAAGDGDSGPNGLQNYPELLLAEREGSNVVVNGTLNSLPNQQFRIVLCGIAASQASNHGGCDAVLDDQTLVTTDANGDAAFEIIVPDNAAHLFMTATASRVVGANEEQTSEFALNIAVSGVVDGIFADGFE